MKKERRADNFIPKPTYPGGPRKMSSFIYTELKYPREDIPDQIKGTVRIKIEINYEGKVIGSQILSSLSPNCDKEAKRVASLLKFDFHRKLRKGKVRYHKTLNIKFSPPPLVKKPTSTKISYTITSNPKSETTVEKKGQPNVYSYTLKIK